MSDGYHLSVYPVLDPVRVAQIADAYGIEAAFERWAPWSKKSVSMAAKRGRRMLARRSPAQREPRQPAAAHGRPQFADSASINAVFGRSGPRRCPSHS